MRVKKYGKVLDGNDRLSIVSLISPETGLKITINITVGGRDK